ncbi:Leucine-rich repeat-containing protein [Artemisia annua]|uniref:Leucine-rich repeat-containing protein n=1 Tax=Artemisia annua TaxID=35608 RepID=A0A2U1NJQ7_ARTAN|nr:Leucine-rich repeat-containing protein [Artemisia annua]
MSHNGYCITPIKLNSIQFHEYYLLLAKCECKSLCLYVCDAEPNNDSPLLPHFGAIKGTESAISALKCSGAILRTLPIRSCHNDKEYTIEELPTSVCSLIHLKSLCLDHNNLKQNVSLYGNPISMDQFQQQIRSLLPFLQVPPCIMMSSWFHLKRKKTNHAGKDRNLWEKERRREYHFKKQKYERASKRYEKGLRLIREYKVSCHRLWNTRFHVLINQWKDPIDADVEDSDDDFQPVFIRVQSKEWLCVMLDRKAGKKVITKKAKKTVAQLAKAKNIGEKGSVAVDNVAIIVVDFGRYLSTVKRSKGMDVFTCHMKTPQLKWKTSSKVPNFGVFVMRHMETFMGQPIDKYDCGLSDDAGKQVSQLNKLRTKYASKFLLSGCNLLTVKVSGMMIGT